jgi:NADH-quinone oxidoreductase subunit E
MSTMQLIGPKEQLFTAEIRHRLDSWLAKYPASQSQSAVIPALHILQAENDGWLSEAVMDALAIYLNIPSISVYEVATFYTMFDLKPVGKHKLNVCTNISCMLNGSEEIVAHLEKRLNIRLGETTEDGKYTLRQVECLGACCGAPMMQVGRDYHEYLTTEKLDSILDGLEK